MQIKFEVNWQIQLSRNLRMTAINISNLTPFIKESIDIVHDRNNQVFEKEWSNVEKNQKWPTLKSKTLVARSRRWWYYKNTPNNPSTLRWTWRLQNDITKHINKNEWILKYNAPYAVYHQSWWKNLPRRAIIDLDNQTNTKIVKALQKFINNQTKIFGKQV